MNPEPGIIGTLLEYPVNGETPFLARILENSPESFDDGRCGQIAAVVKNLRREGQPVHSVAVAERVNFPDCVSFIMQAVADAFPVSVAEFESEKLWRNFQARRSAQLLDEGATSITKNPEQAADIRAHIVSELARLDADGSSLAERLNASRFDPKANHERPAPVFSIGRTPVSTLDNLTNIIAQAKHCKTAVNGAMIASTFAAEGADCLGFNSENPKGYAVGHLDTEQSPFDHAEQNRLIERRAGQPLPKWFESFHLAGFKAADIRAAIPLLMEQWKKRFGGIHSVFVDGIADAAQDVNDPAESNAFVAELHALAIFYHCTLIQTIHLNPGSDFKTRGHLGSQLERKAETNLKIEKDVDEIFVLYAEKNRHAAILKKSGPRFTWNNEQRMHVSVESQQDAKENLEFDEMSTVFKSAFASRPAMSNADLKTTVTHALSVVGRTADRKIARAVTLGIIKKTFGGLYELRT